MGFYSGHILPFTHFPFFLTSYVALPLQTDDVCGPPD